MKEAKDFRRIARESLKGNWMIAVLMGLAASLLGAIKGGGLDINFQKNMDQARVNVDFSGVDIYSASIDGANTIGMETFLSGIVTYVMFIAVVLMIVQFILGCIVGIGYARFNLDLIDRKELTAGTLFAYFPQWKNMLKAGILQAVYVFLWSLLFIIPGIVAMYRYAMTSYILAENPEMDADIAIEHSKEMMNGNKWRLFCLQFSFIGWHLLCILTLGIGNLWVMPYEQAAQAAFYRDLIMPLADAQADMPMFQEGR